MLKLIVLLCNFTSKRLSFKGVFCRRSQVPSNYQRSARYSYSLLSKKWPRCALPLSPSLNRIDGKQVPSLCMNLLRRSTLHVLSGHSCSGPSTLRPRYPYIPCTYLLYSLWLSCLVPSEIQFSCATFIDSPTLRLSGLRPHFSLTTQVVNNIQVLRVLRIPSQNLT